MPFLAIPSERSQDVGYSQFKAASQYDWDWSRRLRSGCVVTWFVTGFRALPQEVGLNANHDQRRHHGREIDGSVIATATRTGDGRWTVDGWLGHFS